MTILIAPSILAADLGDIRNEIRSVTRAGADWIHIDVMDGTFVPPITFGANVVAVARSITSKPLDVHLMIEHPETQIKACADAGANYLTVHVEACPDLTSVVNGIRAHGMKPGVTLKPETPIESIFPVLGLVDLVLIMTVNPGWGGQKFMPAMLDKVRATANECRRIGVCPPIEVDGGINDLTSKQCIEAGASVLVAGNYIFSTQDRASAIASLRNP